MGVILSKLRGKKESSKERLEAIEKELRDIQRFQYDTQLKQKRIIGKIWVYSSVIYLLSAVALYFFVPRGKPWKEQIWYIIPLIVFPFLMYAVKWLTAWYFENKIVSNREKYAELKKERERILEDVMDNETYKVAKEILEKYAPSELLPKYLAKQQSTTVTPVSSLRQETSASTYVFQGDLRRRQQQSFGTSTPIRAGVRTNFSQSPVIRPGGPGQYLRQPTNAFPYQRPQLSIMGSPSGPSYPAGGAAMSSQRIPSYMLPAAPSNPTLHNRKSGWMDKLVDYVVGDGAANRYALICRYCATHNGLATPEEYPYTGFRCVYCHQFNPARQPRPTAPKLPVNEVLIEEMEQSTSSTRSETSPGPGGNDPEKKKSNDSESSDAEGPIITLEETPEKKNESEVSSDHDNDDNETDDVTETEVESGHRPEHDGTDVSSLSETESAEVQSTDDHLAESMKDNEGIEPSLEGGASESTE